MPVYQYDDIKADVQNQVHGTISDTNYRLIINRAVKSTLNDVDLRSTKRRANISPPLYRRVYDYAAPSDLKGTAIIDIRKQVSREEEFDFLNEEEFDRQKENKTGIFTLADDDFVRLLRISSDIADTTVVLHNGESLTGNGTWSAADDASNITLDTEDFIQGNASLNFDTASGATTAYLENSTLDSADLTGYEQGDVFVWIYVPNASIPTNFILRVGTDSSNYFSVTVTTNNEGVAFYVGWNLLRFSLSGATQTGTVTMADIGYVRLTITKDSGDAAATDWRLDYVVARKGSVHYATYYSKYLWQDVSGTYIQDSIADTDYINVDAEEYNIIVDKCAEFAAMKLDNEEDKKDARGQYADDVIMYRAQYPSEAKAQTITYETF